MTELTKNDAWGVIFDMDGVLIDSYRSHLAAFQRMLANYDLKMSEEQFANIFGRTNPDIFALLYPEFNPEDYARLSDEKEAAFRDIIADNFPEMDGAAELIDALHGTGAILAIGSSGSPENVETVLRMLPGGEHIRVTTHAKEITRGKPDPEVFLNAAGKMGLPPARCVVVEDAPVGVTAGKAAGCAVVGITGTVSRRYLKEADLVIDSLRDLTPAIFMDLIASNATQVIDGV
jgi:HAD superfamily hydrolase (TIGR01509 family)